MPKNDPWDQFASKPVPEVSFKDGDDEVHVVPWNDIRSKTLDEDGDVILRTYPDDREYYVSPEMLVDMYKQVGLPIPSVLAEELKQHNIKLDASDIATPRM
ncbi:MAG: hypothetical protein Alpg2KO_27570 [Alphaproteobacteria bacterium]